MVKWIKARCRRCGREYIYADNDHYIPKTCSDPECMYKELHKNLYPMPLIGGDNATIKRGGDATEQRRGG